MSINKKQKSQQILYLTRKETFSAAHTLNNKNLSQNENKEIFSKCNNCHGHNYNVEITVKGTINPKSGMLINITILKKYIQDILEKLDHKNLDVDVEYFHDVISTTENLTIYVWNELEKKLIEGKENNDYDCNLYEVKIFETDKNICIYRGE